MQGRGRSNAPPPIGIAFEADLGRRLDAVLAIAMLNGFTAKNEARLISLSVSRPSLETARLAEVLCDFYFGAVPRGSAGIGMPEGASSAAEPLAGVLSTPGDSGAPRYTSSIESTLDTADNAVLIRNMLLAQNDGNASIVLAGPATALVRLLDLYGARPQIQAKVRHLVVAAGAFPSGGPDASLGSDVQAARRLFAEWPTPIVAAGAEVGTALAYPAASFDRDFTWAPVHPVVDTYRWGTPAQGSQDVPAAALAAVAWAVHPDDSRLRLSDPGTIGVTDDGRTTFTPDPAGRHRYLIVDPVDRPVVVQSFTALVSAQPAPRPTRGRRGAPPAAAVPPLPPRAGAPPRPPQQ